MQIYPTTTTAHLTIASIGMVAAGLIAGQPAVVGWGGAVFVAVALARAVTMLSVARIRAAGFEMIWVSSDKTLKGARGGVLEVEAELRNRDSLAARFVRLRPIASPNLRVTVEPASGEIPASGRLSVRLHVELPRVGQHGLHGLTLEVYGAPAMFEVPLTFANPLGVEVLPRSLWTLLHQPRGGRSRLAASSGRAGPSRGDSSDLRELREHQPGDPFRRIAWRASARRGRLFVREMDREERDVVWLVLDASVALWSGAVGSAPLDYAIDEVATLIARYTERGDSVGLCVIAADVNLAVEPATGPAHAAALAKLLITATAAHDARRSELDEPEVARLVMEHLQPLDPRGLADVPVRAFDSLANRAEATLARAPFNVEAPRAPSARERTLRRYLASFGVGSAPRIDVEPGDTGPILTRVFEAIARHKPAASVIHVFGAAPLSAGDLTQQLRRLQKKGTRVLWSLPRTDDALAAASRATTDENTTSHDAKRGKPPFGDALAPARDVLVLRSAIAQARERAALRKAGVTVLGRRRG